MSKDIQETGGKTHLHRWIFGDICQLDAAGFPVMDATQSPAGPASLSFQHTLFAFAGETQGMVEQDVCVDQQQHIYSIFCAELMMQNYSFCV